MYLLIKSKTTIKCIKLHIANPEQGYDFFINMVNLEENKHLDINDLECTITSDHKIIITDDVFKSEITQKFISKFY